MMDEETWISAADALEMGFATSVVNAATGKTANQSLKKRMVEMILERQAARMQTPKPEPEPEPDPAPEPEPEPEPENKLPNLLAALFR